MFEIFYCVSISDFQLDSKIAEEPTLTSQYFVFGEAQDTICIDIFCGHLRTKSVQLGGVLGSCQLDHAGWWWCSVLLIPGDLLPACSVSFGVRVIRNFTVSQRKLKVYVYAFLFSVGFTHFSGLLLRKTPLEPRTPPCGGLLSMMYFILFL